MTRLGVKRGTARLEPHSSLWSALFQEEAARLRTAFGELALDIQHIGSTSVPGLSAKPVLDIGVSVATFDWVPDLSAKLEALGYESLGHLSEQMGYIFKRFDGDLETHIVHVLEVNNPHWRDYLHLRDYLTASEDARRRYEQHKLGLSEQFAANRRSYTRGKHDLIQVLLEEARLYPYDQAKLTAFYDQDASRRDRADMDGWKREERRRFLTELQAEGKTTLLELGAGPGRDSLFFKEHGLDVLAADLSPEMVRLCRAKGLTAQVADMMALPFEAGRFDAVYALNSLLHVPKERFEETLQGARRVLKPGGLFYLGLYGGPDSERLSERDPAGLERFFATYSDRVLLERVMAVFDLVYFRRVRVAADDSYHFQSLIMRKP